MVLPAVTDHAEHWLIFFTTGAGSAVLWRMGNAFAKSMAPLPANSGWWMTTIYGFVKIIFGHDPSANGKS